MTNALRLPSLSDYFALANFLDPRSSAGVRNYLNPFVPDAPEENPWRTEEDPWSARVERNPWAPRLEYPWMPRLEAAPETFETSGARKSFDMKDLLDRNDVTTPGNPYRKSWT